MIGTCGIFSYQLAALDANFQEAGLTYHTLTNYSELIDVANEENYITTEQKQVLQEWRQDPENWA